MDADYPNTGVLIPRRSTILPAGVDARNGPQPNYNVAPTSELEIITWKDGAVAIEPVVWGLVPHWAKDDTIRAQINARGETVSEKPFFRTAFEHRRCLVPATGYYEWKKEGNGKQPYLVHLPGDLPTAHGARRDRWDS